MTGRLVLVATPIGNLGDVSARARDALAAADVIGCEDTRRTGRLLVHLGIAAPRLVVVNEHTEARATDALLAQVLAGATVALVSDAGMPGISDPGERVVAGAVAAGVQPEVVGGPVAAVCALVASGLPTERWVMEGFVPRSGAERRRRLAEVAAEPRTVVLYEAPHRLARTLADLAGAAGPERRVVVARELSKLHEQWWRGTLGEAVGHWEETEPRGEYVLVLAGAEPTTAEATDVDGALRAELATGASARAAADAVAGRLGTRRQATYRRAVELSHEASGPPEA